MARLRIFLVLVLALTAGGAFAFGTYRYIQQVPDRGEGIETRPVIVAAANLALGAEVRPEDVRIVEWPVNSVPTEAFAQRRSGRRPRSDSVDRRRTSRSCRPSWRRRARGRAFRR